MGRRIGAASRVRWCGSCRLPLVVAAVVAMVTGGALTAAHGA
jgi:hypothetical protein